MPSPYNDVELTDSDKQGIYENPGMKEDQNPVEAGVDGVPSKGVETHETNTLETEVDRASEVSESETAEESSSESLEDYEIEIDGKTYDGAQIMKWSEDYGNDSKWQATNTQKAQELAPWSKLTEKIASDNEFREYLKDYFYEDEKGLKALGLDGELTPLAVEESEVTAEPAEPSENLTAIEERLENMELERVVDDLEVELEGIIDSNPNLFKEEKDEMSFLEFVQDNNMTNLGDAFKVWAYDNLKGELDHQQKLDGNRERNRGKVVHSSEIGAQEVAEPKTYKEMKDINISDPDIAKYFNK